MARAMRVQDQCRGLSLVDTVVGAGVLLLVMVVLLNLGGTAIFTNRAAEERAAAEGYASSLLEAERAKPFHHQPVPYQTEPPPIQLAGTTYQATIAGEAVAGQPEVRLRVLTVKVQWTSRRGEQETRQSLYVSPMLQ